MRVRYWLIAIFILLVRGGLAAQEQPPLPVLTYSPPQLTSEPLCRQECFSQTVTIGLPPPPAPPYDTIDMVLLMDLSGSMEEELDTVKLSIQQIVTTLRADVPDLRFGFASFSDTSDNPYTLIANLSQDLESFTATLAPIELDNSGGNEPPLNALLEVSQLSWRPEALRVAVLFTDEPAESGRDVQETIDELIAQNLAVVVVFSDNNPPLANFWREFALETYGDFFQLNQADEIPNAVITLVQGQLRRRNLTMGVEPLDFELDDAAPTWLRLSPDTFAYPEQGGDIPVQIDICPAEINARPGEYNFNLNVTQGRNDFGGVPVSFSYFPLCADFVIPDTATDRGENCTADGIYWNTPSIVLRYVPDGGITSVAVQPNVEQYVYVTVQNIGVRPSSGDLILYSGVSEIMLDFPQGWQEVARIAVLPELAPQETRTVGPFSWTPNSTAQVLRVVAQVSEDPITNPNDVRCENNIALVSTWPLQANYPTFAGNVANGVGGQNSFSVSSTQPYDLIFDLANLSGEVIIQSATGLGNSVEGNSVTATGGSPLTLEQLPPGNNTFNVLLSSAESGTYDLPIAAEIASTPVSGTVLRYTVDTSQRIPLQSVSDNNPATAAIGNTERLLLIGLALLALVILIVAIFVRHKPSEET